MEVLDRLVANIRLVEFFCSPPSDKTRDFAAKRFHSQRAVRDLKARPFFKIDLNGMTILLSSRRTSADRRLCLCAPSPSKRITMIPVATALITLTLLVTSDSRDSSDSDEQKPIH